MRNAPPVLAFTVPFLRAIRDGYTDSPPVRGRAGEFRNAAGEWVGSWATSEHAISHGYVSLAGAKLTITKAGAALLEELNAS